MEAEWDQEDTALKNGADPAPCPQCRRRGFYAPRWATPSRKYFACKFCGYWQDVGKPPHEIIRYECRNNDGHCVADWKEPQESWRCPECGKTFDPQEAVEWPADDPDHCWHSAPEQGTQDDYKTYWQSKGVKPPRFGIP